MRFLALVTDYDGTIAHHSRVPATTVAALRKLSASGRKLILCTGREIRYLVPDFPELEIFDVIVAENGGVLYYPRTKEERILGEPPRQEFVEGLLRRGVSPLSVGKVVVATWVPNEKAVLEEIHRLGLELQLTFNKGAVMVLPIEASKRSGVKTALKEMHLSPHNAVGIGDAENDYAFLTYCEFGVATENALPSIKKSVDYVTKLDHGAGVEEIIGHMIRDDLASLPQSRRGFIELGTFDDGSPACLPPFGHNILVAGRSASGKTTLTHGILEKFRERLYQACIIDPEGDYEHIENVLPLGDPEHAARPEQIVNVLQNPDELVAVNLLGVKLEDRPAFLSRLYPLLQGLRTRFGRPHWIVIDEAHHMLSEASSWGPEILPSALTSTIFITIHPAKLARIVLDTVDMVICVGEEAAEVMKDCLEACRLGVKIKFGKLDPGEALFFERGAGVRKVKLRLPKVEHLRHKRKYSQGDLGERGFVFRGPRGKLKLRAQNLQIFTQLAEGVDDSTWNYHLKRHDYSKWFRENIKDDSLAQEAERIESDASLSCLQSRHRIAESIERRYTSG